MHICVEVHVHRVWGWRFSGAASPAVPSACLVFSYLHLSLLFLFQVLPSPSLCECVCVCVVQEIEPGLHAFSACDVDGRRTTRIFFPLNSEPGTRVSLAILLLEDLGLHTQHSGASLHP